MRPRPRFPLVALALVLSACGGSDRNTVPAAHETTSTANRYGPDALVLRMPRAGGIARVFAYPKLDSVIWTSSNAGPPIDRVLAFDGEGGSIAYVDSRGVPARINLRLADVALATTPRAKLSALASVDGSAIYGIGADGVLARFTPSGDWVFKPPHAAHAVLPQRDGSVLLLAQRGAASVVWRLHPPEPRILDSVIVPPAGRVLRTQLGDRVYLVDEGRLVGLRTRTLEPLPTITFDAPIIAVTATPSGDRLFVATRSNRALSVVDRYRDKVASTIELPGQPLDLRMDPVGRYVLVRAANDSAWVIAVGTDQPSGTVHSEWRRDLPFVLPDGAIALAQGKDVVVVDAQTLKPRQRLAGGTSDFWYGFLWNGLRPRPKGLDQQARFQSDSVDSVRAAAARDSAAALDSTRVPPVAPPAAAPPTRAAPQAPAPPRRDTATTRGWLVQFAALLSDQAARQRASQIHVRGVAPHVVTATREGTTIYRVVLGPYPTRDAADAVGRESGQSYWIYAATP